MKPTTTTKSMLVFGLATAIVTSALVFDGMAHRHTANGSQTVSQTPVANAAAALSSSDPATKNQATEDQSAAVGTDSATANDPGQDQTVDGAVQTQSDADASAAAPVDNGDPQADAPQANNVPAIVIPSGTTFTVRLNEDLGSRISEVGQKFSATLDQDVVVGGQTVIAAGARVKGKVVSVRPAGALAGEANLQLKLTSVKLDNGSVGLTTSVRSFGPKIKGKNKVGRFMKGLVKRASGEEREVLLAEQSAYSFTLQGRLRIQ
jgi:hypothetical protein